MDDETIRETLEDWRRIALPALLEELERREEAAREVA